MINWKQNFTNNESPLRTIQKYVTSRFRFWLIVALLVSCCHCVCAFYPCPSPASHFPIVDCCVAFRLLRLNAPRQTALKLTPKFIRECWRCSTMHGGGGRQAGFRRIGPRSDRRGEVSGLFGGSQPLWCCRWLLHLWSLVGSSMAYNSWYGLFFGPP